MKNLIIITITSLFLVSGCAPKKEVIQYNQESERVLNLIKQVEEKNKIKNKITTERDDFQKYTTFTGMPVEQESDNVRILPFLRAWKYDSSKNVTAQIYVSFSYYTVNNVFLYKVTRDLEGNMLETIHIDSDVKQRNCSEYLGCLVVESVGIMVDTAYLERYKDKEIKLQVSGKGGKTVFTIPADYTKAFLDAIK
jgi:hypothetical protein